MNNAHILSVLVVIAAAGLLHVTELTPTTTGHAAKEGVYNIIAKTPEFGDFQLGHIVHVEIPVRSQWHEDIPGVRAQVDLYEKGKRIHRFTSLSKTIPALEKTTIQATWNTDGIPPGTYTMRTIVEYEDGQTIVDRQLRISEDEVRAHRTLTIIDWIQIALAVIAGIAVAIFAVRRFMRKAKPEEEEDEKV